MIIAFYNENIKAPKHFGSGAMNSLETIFRLALLWCEPPARSRFWIETIQRAAPIFETVFRANYFLGRIRKKTVILNLFSENLFFTRLHYDTLEPRYRNDRRKHPFLFVVLHPVNKHGLHPFNYGNARRAGKLHTHIRRFP